VGKLLYCLLASFLGMVIVHICVLFLIPTYAGNPLMERLEKQSAPWQFVPIDGDNPIAARQDPTFRLRICHFDLNEEPIHLAA